MEKSELTSGPTYHVRMFRTGKCRVKGEFAYKNYARDRDHLYYIYITIIQGNGITAVVDTGMESVAEMNHGAGFLLSELITQDPGEDTASILARAGVTSEQVDYVLLTHCHYDHCSNLPMFPNAQVVIPETAWRVWHTEAGGADYLHNGLLDYMRALDADGRLLLMDDGMVTPGIGVRWVGGHSPCSQFIYVNTETGVAALLGDAVQMLNNLVKDDIIAICADEAQCWRALEIARAEPDYVLPGHDPVLLEKYPDGIVA